MSGVVSTTAALHDAVEPPLAPVQLQVHCPVPVTAVAVPATQRLVVGAEANTPPFAEPQLPFVVIGAETVVTLNVAETPPIVSTVLVKVL